MSQSPTTLLPKGVSPRNGRYYLVKKVNGKTTRIPLTRVEEGLLAVRAEWEKYQGEKAQIRTVTDLLYAYLKHGTEDLSVATVQGYTGQIKAKLIPVFGAMHLARVTPAHVAQFLKEEKKAGSAVSANRARAVLSAAFAYALGEQLVERNPCHGVRRNKERPSRRYVKDAELQAALAKAHPSLQVLLDAAYLTGLRQVDLIWMRREQITERGIEITESKTQKPRLMLWTDALRAVINAAIAQGDAHIERRSKRRKQQFAKPEFVFINQRGLPWSPGGIAQAMERCDASFTFRQLRPKAASDADHNVLGHTGQMLARYVRREKLTPVR